MFKIAFWVYLWAEVTEAVRNQLNQQRGDRELYTLFHGRSELLTDYDGFINSHQSDPDSADFAEFQGLSDISSVYI